MQNTEALGMKFIGQKEYVVINGVRQGMFFAGKDFSKPVILFLHGGPGSPEYALFHSDVTKKCMEDYFTICYWEQRGAGMSYNKKLAGNDITLDKLASDTIEVSKHLIAKFKVEKIYLMAHSFGTVLGIKAIQQNPELYHAYIPIGQVVNVRTSEQNIYNIMLDYAAKANDEQAVGQLKKIDSNAPDFPTLKYMMAVRNRLTHKYGLGITRVPDKMSTLYKKLFFFSGYTMQEKINFFRGLSFGIKLLPELSKVDLRNEPLTFHIPIYFMHGIFDGQVSLKLAKQYFEMITAPCKAFFEFINSAHSPNYDEQEEFVSVLKTALKI